MTEADIFLIQENNVLRHRGEMQRGQSFHMQLFAQLRL
jgi:hypothetical protein